MHDDAIAVECAVVLYFSCSIPLLKGVQHFGGSFHHIRRGDDNERTCRTVPTIMCSSLVHCYWLPYTACFKVKFLIGNKKFLLLMKSHLLLFCYWANSSSLLVINKGNLRDFKKLSLTVLSISWYTILGGCSPALKI